MNSFYIEPASLFLHIRKFPMLTLINNKQGLIKYPEGKSKFLIHFFLSLFKGLNLFLYKNQGSSSGKYNRISPEYGRKRLSSSLI